MRADVCRLQRERHAGDVVGTGCRDTCPSRQAHLHCDRFRCAGLCSDLDIAIEADVAAASAALQVDRRQHAALALELEGEHIAVAGFARRHARLQQPRAHGGANGRRRNHDGRNVEDDGGARRDSHERCASVSVRFCMRWRLAAAPCAGGAACDQPIAAGAGADARKAPLMRRVSCCACAQDDRADVCKANARHMARDKRAGISAVIMPEEPEGSVSGGINGRAGSGGGRQRPAGQSGLRLPSAR